MNSDDPPLLETKMLVAAPGQCHVVSYQYQRSLTAAAEREQEFCDLLRGRIIQVSSRFICKKNLGLDGEGAGNSYALLLSSGKLLGIVIAPI